MKYRKLMFIGSAVTAAVLAACSASDITAPRPDPNAQRAELFGWGSSPTLIPCPTSTTQSSSSLISILGGTVSVAGVSIAIPAGALLSDATVTVTVPASPYLEVDISVEGSEHFIFELPVVVTMSYARCNQPFWTPLSAWYIDSETHQLLEQMPSLQNYLLKTVTFTTGHLSGYAIAN